MAHTSLKSNKRKQKRTSQDADCLLQLRTKDPTIEGQKLPTRWTFVILLVIPSSSSCHPLGSILAVRSFVNCMKVVFVSCRAALSWILINERLRSSFYWVLVLDGLARLYAYRLANLSPLRFVGRRVAGLLLAKRHWCCTCIDGLATLPFKVFLWLTSPLICNRTSILNIIIAFAAKLSIIHLASL